MSKPDSSWTMMMCGRLPAAWQVSPIVGSSRSAITASYSMNPCVGGVSGPGPKAEATARFLG